MPPKIKVTKDEIISAGLQIVRESSADSLSARAIARRIGCSTQPIFSNFPNMEALCQSVLSSAYALYAERTFSAMDSGRYPPYKASGMAYIEFAAEEPELFKMLYMRDRSGETIVDDTEESERIIAFMMKETGLTGENAHLLHRDLWIVVHGLATMAATGFHQYHEEIASEILSETYYGLLMYFRKKEEEQNDRDQDI